MAAWFLTRWFGVPKSSLMKAILAAALLHLGCSPERTVTPEIAEACAYSRTLVTELATIVSDSVGLNSYNEKIHRLVFEYREGDIWLQVVVETRDTITVADAIGPLSSRYLSKDMAYLSVRLTDLSKLVGLPIPILIVMDADYLVAEDRSRWPPLTPRDMLFSKSAGKYCRLYVESGAPNRSAIGNALVFRHTQRQFWSGGEEVALIDIRLVDDPLATSVEVELICSTRTRVWLNEHRDGILYHHLIDTEDGYHQLEPDDPLQDLVVDIQRMRTLDE